MSLTDLIALIHSGHWLPLIALATLIARKWTSPDSKFPITIPPTWQPTVTAAGGLVYGLVSALQTGQSVGMALVGMAIAAGSGGFLDGVLTAIFDHDNAPVWARSIVFIFDDLTGKGPPPAPKSAAAVRIAKSIHPPPPPVATRVDWQPMMTGQRTKTTEWARALLWVASCVFCLTVVGRDIVACNKPLTPPPNTPADVEGALSCVTAALLTGGGNIDACVLKYGPALVADVIQTLLHSVFAKGHPELIPTMQTHLAGLKAKMAAP
jgi:hypothetical protein